jgi:predicted nucleotidyltransferase
VLILDEATKARLFEIRRKHRIRLIVAFGSRVEGRLHEKSDLDLGVLLERRERPIEIYADLQAVFPDVAVDVALLNGADPLLLNEVNGNCELLSGEELDFQQFRLQAFHLYQDFRPYLELEAEMNARRLQEP